jgi:lipopolysaccharide transport system ATP-binding protein
VTMNMATTQDNVFDAGAAPAAKDSAIIVDHVTKRFALFNRPEDRLKQMLVPRLQRLVRAEPSRYFREFTAVNDVSLTIAKGETIGIIGRNGSGKSTLLQMIVSTLAPTSGSVKVNGRIAALLELGAGFNPEFSGRENVYVNGAILGFSRAEMDERFEAIAAFAGIGEFIERPVKTYSSGMFVRLAFAVSTAVEPDILVVDEALSVGDEAFQRKCFARIEAIKERGGTILFVSHGAQTIVQLCDRAVLLDGGEKILEGEPKLVVGQYQRLINASDEAASGIRQSILQIEGTILPKPETALENTLETAEYKDQTDTSNVEMNEGWLSEAYLSDSVISYEHRGARISNVRLETMEGKGVNHIFRGKKYCIIYDVYFENECKNIGFSTFIKTSTGLYLSGASTQFVSSKILKFAASKISYRVKFCFFNSLIRGVYFINAGVTGYEKLADKNTGISESYFLHRITDAFIFKVVDDSEQREHGLVGIFTSGSIKGPSQTIELF